MKRRIAVFTGTRAEYGLLHGLMKAIQDDATLELQVIVSGAHLAPQFGQTWRQIEADGFPIAAKIDMLLAADTEVAVTKAMGLCLIGMADALERLRPDLLVLLGDRYEALVAAQAAMVARIPIAHIHGGETTQGAIDEAIRHAITKMSHLHFVAADAFRQRVVQLGEDPRRVWVVGAAGLDNIARLSPMNRDELARDLGIELRRPLFVVTYHPVTLSGFDAGVAMSELLDALAGFDGTIVITGTNADPGAQSARTAAESFIRAHPGRAVLVESLGVRRYLSLVAEADVVVGNSSSGLLEAPALGTATVDIGERQTGRLHAPSVIHCDESGDAIRAAVARALTPAHRELAQHRRTPYGTPGAAARIHAVLRSHTLHGLLQKAFFDAGGQT